MRRIGASGGASVTVSETEPESPAPGDVWVKPSGWTSKKRSTTPFRYNTNSETYDPIIEIPSVREVAAAVGNSITVFDADTGGAKKSTTSFNGNIDQLRSAAQAGGVYAITGYDTFNNNYITQTTEDFMSFSGVTTVGFEDGPTPITSYNGFLYYANLSDGLVEIDPADGSSTQLLSPGGFSLGGESATRLYARSGVIVVYSRGGGSFFIYDISTGDNVSGAVSSDGIDSPLAISEDGLISTISNAFRVYDSGGSLISEVADDFTQLGAGTAFGSGANVFYADTSNAVLADYNTETEEWSVAYPDGIQMGSNGGYVGVRYDPKTATYCAFGGESGEYVVISEEDGEILSFGWTGIHEVPFDGGRGASLLTSPEGGFVGSAVGDNSDDNNTFLTSSIRPRHDKFIYSEEGWT